MNYDVCLEVLYSNDFKYCNKYSYDYNLDAYVFNVYGETANYLMNRYNLEYDNVFVICLIHNTEVDFDTVFIGSSELNGIKKEQFEPEDMLDIVRIQNLLKPFIKSINLV